MNLRNCYFFIGLFGLSLPALALKGDTDQPINIDSGTQSLDMEKNIVTFSDNVVITQGSIHIRAAQVTITRQEGKKETVKASGSPVTFQQTLDDGKIVKGSAAHVDYDLGTEFLILRGNAQLRQQDSFIQASQITYDVKKQQLKATSGEKSGRVKTVLIPNQLQKK